MATDGAESALDTDQDWRWQAVIRRDPAADGRFWYSVATTGIYCRPSCPSRRARRRNVVFHESCAAAERAGFRPCLRCRPTQSNPSEAQETLVAAARDRLALAVASGDPEPGLAELAEMAGLSPFHFHRVFKRHTGLTPKQFAANRRAEAVRAALSGESTVTEAIYGAGYGSSSRFYERSGDLLGMTATAWRRGGQGVEIRFAVGQCSLGAILVAATARGVCAIEFADDPHALVDALQARFPDATLIGGDGAFEALVAEIVGRVEAPSAVWDLPLDLAGTAFQHRVWQALRAIPAGQRASYAEIARRIDQPQAIRAVAGACAANRVALAIPCHRVIRTDGGLSGYRWGVERKQALLAREAAVSGASAPD